MIYQLYLKSHMEAPDYEDSVEADSFEEAVNYFYEYLSKYGWDRETIAENTQDIEAVYQNMLESQATGN